MKYLNSVAALTALLPSVAFASPTQGNSGASSLPKVDLGYEIYRANSLNDTTGLYKFSNIRYAAPPTGKNRFAAPQAPEQNRSTVQVDRPEPICPQANPLWGLTTQEFLLQYFMGQRSFNQSDFDSPLPAGISVNDISLDTFNTSIIPTVDPRTTEDCLFLDVVVPQHIFKNKKKGKHGKGAAVLVWIYGGGYTGGSKTGGFDPTGLLARSQDGEDDDGVIYVALNYRLGAFGWLSGSTLQANGTSNAALHDQRFALDWVQKNIGKFGGDPKRVTVFGESAGGGSIMGQLTAYGGRNGSAPFSQAILQSPGFIPLVSSNQQEKITQDFLKLLNVSTIEEARNVSTAKLQLANALTVGLAEYGGFTYGPAVDGDFLPALPGQSLARGQFDKKVKVMVGHNANEGLSFTPPFINNSTDIQQQVASVIPAVRAFPETLDYITSELYPPVFDGTQAQGYTNNIDRASALVAELIFTCNTFYLDKAYNNQTYSYLFSVPPALHGADIKYTFYNANVTSTDLLTGVPNPAVALALQQYITTFAQTGNPNTAGVPHFNLYAVNSTVQNLNITGISELRDATANERCNWWQKGLYT